ATLQLLLHLPYRDRAGALAAGPKIDDLVCGPARVDRLAVRPECDVFDRHLQLVAEVVDGAADLRKTDAGVEQLLDHTQLDDVVEAVHALAARPVGVADARRDELGAR